MTVLDRIIERKREEVARLASSHSPGALRKSAESMPPCRDFISGLEKSEGVAVIAEIKRSAPSTGRLKEVSDVVGLARTYETGGAAALSVLTDGPFFGGNIEDLVRARAAVGLPVLRKDFMLDPIQLYEARLAGADAVLLIVAALTDEVLADLFQESRRLGMTAIVEVHDRKELDRALALNPPVVGINNRNLATLDVNLDTTIELKPLVPDRTLVIAESGIRDRNDVLRLRNAGVKAFLIGTTLMRSADPAATLRGLCNGEA
ncbi:MAG: indole-3-glycerol phosphate synthase TrpC [Pseudomonadota bacterium]